MEAMRQSWTDDRLDDLSHRMDERFDQVEAEMDQRFEKVESEMKAGFERVDGEVKELRGEVKELRGEIKEQGKELRGEMAGIEGRLRAQASEHYVKVREEFASLHNDNRQLNAEMHALQRTIVQITGAGVITLIATVAGVLIAHL